MRDLLAIVVGIFKGMEQLIFLMLLTWPDCDVGFFDSSREDRLLLTSFRPLFIYILFNWWLYVNNHKLCSHFQTPLILSQTPELANYSFEKFLSLYCEWNIIYIQLSHLNHSYSSGFTSVSGSSSCINFPLPPCSSSICRCGWTLLQDDHWRSQGTSVLSWWRSGQTSCCCPLSSPPILFGLFSLSRCAAPKLLDTNYCVWEDWRQSR